jgi:pyridoxamine 5'-phosphate oxidase
MSNIAALRAHYTRQSLSEQDVHADPIQQFNAWFEEAVSSQLREPNAMTLATANAVGRPSARTVLLKGFDAAGFVFFTNYESRKGADLSANPQAALLFTWLELERQIRIEGHIEPIGAAQSLAYFQSRPKGSQIGAWASPQSQVIATRDLLEARQHALEEQYKDDEVLPLPPFWGGYVLKPVWFEFWQGRPNRLHDRIQYEAQPEGAWRISRLAP